MVVTTVSAMTLVHGPICYRIWWRYLESERCLHDIPYYRVATYRNYDFFGLIEGLNFAGNIKAKMNVLTTVIFMVLTTACQR